MDNHLLFIHLKKIAKWTLLKDGRMGILLKIFSYSKCAVPTQRPLHRGTPEGGYPIRADGELTYSDQRRFAHSLDEENIVRNTGSRDIQRNSYYLKICFCRCIPTRIIALIRVSANTCNISANRSLRNVMNKPFDE